jgi:16S rRNA processing protein RimM
VPFFIDTIRPHQDRFVARLEGVDDEQMAQQLSGADIFLPDNLLPELDEKHFYFHEVPGWELIDEVTQKSAGIIVRVVEHGPYPLIETEIQGKHALIPLPDHISVYVDRTAQRLTLELPEGLLDVFLDPAGPSDDHD